MSDYDGAAFMPAMPKARQLRADKDYDADRFRAAPPSAACIPSKSNRKAAIPYDTVLYKQCQKIENVFGRLKDWRRIHTETTVAPTPNCRHSHRRSLFWL